MDKYYWFSLANVGNSGVSLPLWIFILTIKIVKLANLKEIRLLNFIIERLETAFIKTKFEERNKKYFKINIS